MSSVVSLNSQQGFTRMDNGILDALLAIDLPARELKVALYIAKRTLNFQAGPSRIKAAEVSKATNIHPDVVSRAISSLLKRRVIFRDGGSRGEIGLTDPKEWVFVECPSRTNLSDSDNKVVSIDDAKLTKTDDSLLYSKKEHLVTVPSEQITAPQAPTGDLAATKPALALFDGEDFQVDPYLIAKWATVYAPVDVESEIAKAAVWAAANPRKAKKDWRRFLVNWLAKKASKAASGVSEEGVPVDKIIDLYHKDCPNLPAVAVRTDKVLRAMLVERWSESETHQHSGFWKTIFARANRTNQVYFRGSMVLPRLEVICSRAVFRQLEEQA